MAALRRGHGKLAGMPRWTQRSLANRPLLAALAVVLLTVGCAEDTGLFDELIDNPPRAALPGDLVVDDTSEADLARPLHNNDAVRYTLTGGEAENATMSIIVVTFTHRQAAVSFMQQQWAAGRMQGVIDDAVEQGELYTPGTPPREDIACVDVSPDGAARAGRVCATVVDRLLVATEVWAHDTATLPSMAFQVSVLDAGADHAAAVLAEN